MKSEEERQMAKIRYEKPTAFDLGPAAPVVGASCADGLGITDDACATQGNSAGFGCGDGNSASGGPGCIGGSAVTT